MASRSPTSQGRLGRWLETFNRVFDFLARLIKLGLFIVAILLLSWRWSYVDWSRTATELIKKYTPVQVQEPPTSATSTTISVQLTPPVARPPIDYLGVYQFGQLVFTTDKPYEVREDTVVFEKLLQKGRPDFDKNFLYAGAEIKITAINEYIGLLVSGGSVEGPVLRGVRCQVIRR